MQVGRPSTSPQPVMTPSAGASTPSIARWAKCGRPWMPELDEGALVDEQVDPLAGGQLAALVLLGDLLLAAAELAFARRSCSCSVSSSSGAVPGSLWSVSLKFAPPEYL